MSKKNKAPAIIKGIQPLDTAELLKNADEDHVKALMSKNFPLWAQYAGIKVDGHKFDFDTHRYLLPIYADTGHEIVWRKAAQLGATVYMLLKLIWFCRYHTLKAGLYFPTGEGVEMLSKDRLGPLIKSNAELEENIRSDANTLGLKQINNVEGNISSLYMLYVGGRASKDSVPLDVLAFDEVRLIDPKDVDQVQERISHSSFKYKIFMSTAGFPGVDIDARFQRGTQLTWHSKCNCFPMDQKIVVRRKGSSEPTTMSFRELESCWESYEVLSWSSRRSKWWYKPITAFHNNGIQKVQKYTFRNGASVVCTPDHEFARVNQSSRQAPFKLDWVPVSAVGTDRPKPFYSRSNAVAVTTHIPTIPVVQGNRVTQVPYDNDTLFVIGAFIAEGSWKTSNWISVTQKWDRDTEIRGRVLKWAENNNLPIKIRDDVIEISLASRSDLIQLFQKCGKGCHNKRIPDELLCGTDHQLSILVEGYLQGDGTKKFIHTDARGFSNNKEFACTTTSEALKDQLVFCFLRLGTPVYVSYSEPKNKKPVWELVYNPESHFCNALYKDSLASVSLRSFEHAGEVEVADITVEDNHNYVLDSGFLVHNCSDGVDLASVFPDCVVEHKGEVYYRCPRCKYRINDPQNGNYVAHNPGADFNSYAVSQLASKFISPKEIWNAYQTTTHMQEFYNAKLGRPYVDEESRPVNDDVFDACINPDLKWQVEQASRKVKGGCAMGVDQGAGYCYVVIKKRGRDGKKDLVHLELIESANPKYWKYDEKTGEQGPVSPFVRLKELMSEFNVGLCVVDAMPNTNDAYAFARDFPTKVFVSWYKDAGQDMVQWYDRAKTREAIRKGSKEIRMKWQVMINRYTGMDYALKQVVEGVMQVPPLGNLVQVYRNDKTGRFEAQEIGKLYKEHLKRLVRQETVINEETGKTKMEWVYLGSDPHFAHANLYCDVALERLKNTALFAW